MVANDFLTDKMPPEWGNIVKEGKDGCSKFGYSMCVPILWSALQSAFNEIDDLKKGINKLKGKGKGEGEGKEK